MTSIHIDSRSRNRSIYPNPAEFTANFQGKGMGEKLNAEDPVSHHSYIKNWTGNLFDQTVQGPTVAGVISAFTQAGAISSINQIVATSNNAGGFRKALNYYRGATIVIGTNRRTVRTSEWLPNNQMLFTCYDTFPDPVTAGSAIVIQDSTQPSSGLFFVPAGLEFDQTYTNLYLYNETRQRASLIVNYNGELALAAILDTTWAATDNIAIVKKPPAAFLCDGGSTNNVVILGNVSNVTNYYQGSFLYVPCVQYTDVTPIGQVTQITLYNVGRSTLSLYPFLTTPPAVGSYVFIWDVFTDNSVPLYNTGFLTANKKDIREICYDVRPVFLTLPNAPLISGLGGSISQNPYVFLTIETEPSSDNNSIPLCTNNTSARRAMFVMKVPNITRIKTAEFVSLVGDDVKGRLQWKPNCNGLSFRIHFPDGSTFKTQEPDTVAPFEPKPNLQISVLLELTSIVEKLTENRRFLISAPI
jgi:hypothetical protein